jgi:hypothetical protein
MISGKENEIDFLTERISILLHLSYFSFYDFVKLFDNQLSNSNKNESIGIEISDEPFWINWDKIEQMVNYTKIINLSLFSSLLFDFSKVNEKTRKLVDEFIKNKIVNHEKLKSIATYYYNLHDNERDVYLEFFDEAENNQPICQELYENK